MGELNLSPDGVITDGYWTRGSFAPSTSTIPAVLSDGSDSTYISLTEDYTLNAGIFYSTIMVSYNTATIPFKARVKSVYPTARVANVGGNTNEKLQMNIWKWKTGDRLTGFAGLVGGGPMAIGSSIANYKGFSTDRFPNGSVITQADIDLLATEIFNLSDTDSRVYAAGITVVYDEQPTVEVQYPLTTVSDPTPVVSWNYFDDLEPQVGFQIEVYLSSNLVYSTGTITSSDKFHEVKTALADGSYTLKIRVAQRWTGPGDIFWSEWTTQNFSVSGTLPYPPEVTLSEQTGFARVSALGYINLFSANGSNFEESGHPEWYSVNNATVSSSATVAHSRTGTRVMTIVPTGSSSETISTPVPAQAGSRYYAGYYTRNAPGTTTNTSECDISFYDSSGSLISTSTGSSATITNNTYTLFTVTATAPANTVWAAVRIKMGATTGTFLVDSAFVMLVPTGSTLPSFTTAPNQVALGGLLETSPNLLSWDNSTIGPNWKWTLGADPVGSILVEADAYTSSAGVSILPSENSGNGFVVDVPSSGTRWMRWSGATTVNLTKVIIKAVWSFGTNSGTVRDNTNTGTTLGSFSKWSNGSYSVYNNIEVNVSAGTGSVVIVFTGAPCQVDSVTLIYGSPSATITRDTTQFRHGDSSLKVQNSSGSTNKITVSTGSLSANGSLTESSNAFEVTAGEQLNVAASIYSPAASRTFGISILYWKDLNAGSIGITDVTGTSSIGSWTEKTGSVTVPANAKYAKLFLYTASTANNEIHHWDRVAVWRNTDYPFSNRWRQGYRNVTGPSLVIEYSEDAGSNWSELGTTALDIGSGVIQLDDYEIAHQTDRIYRGYVIGTWDDIIRRSQNSASTAAANIDLPNVWIHKISNPAGTVHNFRFDGGGRHSSPGANPVLNDFAGRGFPVAFFSEVDDFQVNVVLQLPDAIDRQKMLGFLLSRELLVFRDQRSRRGRGIIASRTLTDEPWGQTITFVFRYAGEQP